jgi:hypothetical protein
LEKARVDRENLPKKAPKDVKKALFYRVFFEKSKKM